MKILVDENIPRMTVEGLRELGHTCETCVGRPIRDWKMPTYGMWPARKAEHSLLRIEASLSIAGRSIPES
jgi:hypothetical protein